MTILVADDHETNRKLLCEILAAEGYAVRSVADGGAALAALQARGGPCVGLIDWQMPVHSGIEVCREARRGANPHALFLILVTVRDSPQDIVTGLQSGANDYIKKPFDQAELLARVRLGVQMIELQQALTLRVQELEAAVAEIKQLKGLLPICGYCKKIRDDHDYWQDVELFVAQHADVKFSHGICPDCFESQIRPQLKAMGVADRDITRCYPGGSRVLGGPTGEADFDPGPSI